TRRHNLVFRLSWQLAATVSHENYHVEDFIQVLLKAPETHAVPAWIDSRFVVDSPFHAGQRLYHAILQPSRSRESKTSAITVSRQFAESFLRRAQNLENVRMGGQRSVAQSEQASQAKQNILLGIDRQ